MDEQKDRALLAFLKKINQSIRVLVQIVKATLLWFVHHWKNDSKDLQTVSFDKFLGCTHAHPQLSIFGRTHITHIFTFYQPLKTKNSWCFAAAAGTALPDYHRWLVDWWLVKTPQEPQLLSAWLKYLWLNFFNIYEKSYCVAPFLMAHHQVGRSPMHIGKMIVIIKSMKDRNQRSRSRLSRSKHAHSIIAIVCSSPRTSLDMDRTIGFWLLQLGEDLVTLEIFTSTQSIFVKNTFIGLSNVRGWSIFTFAMS